MKLYSWIWAKLPGGKISKSLVVVVLLAGISLFMFIFGFPALEKFFNVDQVTITE